MAARRYFGPDFLRFLAELSRHNRRDWFLANKDRYEASVRDPFLRFITDLGPRLRRLTPRFVADPSPVGGSMMRIYRDIRFSRDKSPYKTAVAAHFCHAALPGESAPALYLHIEPGKSSIGGGIWHPPSVVADEVRDAIVHDPTRWWRITLHPAFRSTYILRGDCFKRPPRGYEHDDRRLADDLKRKDFIIASPLANGQVTSKDFIDTVIDRYRTAMPFMRFLAESVYA